MGYGVVVQKGWFVRGESGEPEAEGWKASAPGWVGWTREWFESEFVKTGEFIGDDSELLCGGGGTLLLFRTHDAAKRYGMRDAAIASGMRRPVPALYVEMVGLSRQIDETERPSVDDLLWDITEEPGVLAAFGEARLLVFEDSYEGTRAIEKLRGALAKRGSEGSEPEFD